MKVSVIIPVGPKHETVIGEALASAKAQTYSDMECIIVNDCGQPLELQPDLMLVSNRRNVAYARNIGIQAATGDLFVCLDADDILDSRFVEKTVQAISDGTWVYTDYILETEKGVSEPRVSREWNVETLWRSGLCFVTCLYPKTAWQLTGGFDETIGHEDWEFHLRLARAGFKGVRLPECLVTYRRWLSERNINQPTNRSQMVIQSRYPLSSLLPATGEKREDEWPVLVYTGKSQREIIINGRELSYKVDQKHNMVSVHPTDVPYIMGSAPFRYAKKGELEPIEEDAFLRGLSLSNTI